MLNSQDEVPRADMRLYVPYPEGCEARIKQSGEREYCFMQNPGEEYFHLLMAGEIYIQFGDEKYCLNCARRRGLITTDRMNWQHRGERTGPGSL